MVDLEFVGDYRQPQLTARQRELGFDGQSAGEFSFYDFLDIINPLQHIPGISTLYREITGDEISAPARIFGGVLFGGPTGFIAAAVNSVYEEIAGEEIGQTVLALFTGDSDAEPQFAESAESNAAAGAAAPLAGAGNPDSLLGPPLTTAAGGAPQMMAPAAPETGNPSHAAAPPGAGSAGLLTGQDAMNALFRDLGGGAPPAPLAATAAAPNPQPANPQPARALPTRALPTRALPGRQEEAARSIPLPPRMLRVGPATPEAAPLASQIPQGSEQMTAGEAAAAHPLIVAQDVPQAAIAERMMEALDKYRAMSQQRQPEPEKDDVRWHADPALPGAGS